MLLRSLLPVLCAIDITVTLAAGQSTDVVFCSYNLENYTTGKPPSESSKYGTKAKPEKSIAALVEIVKSIHPDVLGVCEMGSADRLADFQQRLAAAGLDFTESEFVAAGDEDRHLALLSRYPIVEHNSQTDVRFTLNGQEERVRRGFLDVTLQVNSSYRLRCVGVHLKSKLPIPEGEAMVRRLEAHKLREHLDGIFGADPNVNLICYGDFNDTKNEPMFQEVSGPKGAPGHLSDLWCRDSLGDRWTHYWKTADQYSRIDYLFVSPGLWPEVNKPKSAIFRGEKWNEASDHRPIFTTIRPVETRSR